MLCLVDNFDFALLCSSLGTSPGFQDPHISFSSRKIISPPDITLSKTRVDKLLGIQRVAPETRQNITPWGPQTSLHTYRTEISGSIAQQFSF